jgi:hypothetical protein
VIRRSVIGLVATCASLSGCTTLGAPASRAPQNPAAAKVQATHEVPSPPARETVAGAGAAATPAQAVRRFAGAYINWTADTVGEDMRALAASSVGQARSALELAAAQTSGDYELERGGIANSGSVEAVAPLPASPNRYVVVTRESTTATGSTAYQGLRPAWHVAIATVELLPGGRWVLSGWQPES